MTMAEMDLREAAELEDEVDELKATRDRVHGAARAAVEERIERLVKRASLLRRTRS